MHTQVNSLLAEQILQMSRTISKISSIDMSVDVWIVSETLAPSILQTKGPELTIMRYIDILKKSLLRIHRVGKLSLSYGTTYICWKMQCCCSHLFPIVKKLPTLKKSDHILVARLFIGFRLILKLGVANLSVPFDEDRYQLVFEIHSSHGRMELSWNGLEKELKV